MRIKLDDLQLCTDCTIFAVNGDVSGLDEARAKIVEDGVAALGPHLVPNFDSETGDGISDFSHRSCDACHSGLAGGFHRFAVLEAE
jgi:hypothetical protein